ncbi:hypothetical protein Kpol_1004p34 [Vanderwaltozyma polyspora DSM 70294]|uniref:GPI transamidase component GPI17 n=1 Tax=Vanderwaltozyma polyspora (strain ATCC 22028 / DSM 70294 / BCRC 21397 / CBS 2163 / NBRC 10782 / NRRL Y-8283 / UCD 57-17) TaxID=436907 RepID=A7TJ91_VANPO|nr:uncharacterized protein Kpol_1004p34 [Vanderwaltozyma polyspora DSM 70294]EDO17660.1 hypothetical protein Kpol_1004p34 [Vanderwaltozyma polyspora DSM 70294]
MGIYGIQQLTLRRLVGLAFVAIYLLFGLPLWYKLTSVHRATLPLEYINNLSHDRHNDIHISIPFFVDYNRKYYSNLHAELQNVINSKLSTLENKPIDWTVNVQKMNEKIEDSIEIDPTSYHVLRLKEGPSLSLQKGEDSTVSIVEFDFKSVEYDDLLQFISNSMLNDIFKLESSHFSNNYNTKEHQLSISYNPTVHLSLSLLSGDGSPISWDIDNSLKNYITPLRKFLSPVFNFTVDTNLVYYSDLNLYKLNELESVSVKDISYVADISEVSSIDDFSEAVGLNLAIVFPSSGTAPTGLNFINSTELTIEGTDISTQWESFVIPQWGVLIINKYPLKSKAVLDDNYLKPIMYQFSEKIIQLLGIEQVNNEMTSPYIILDSFKRYVTVKNLDKSLETLESLVRLTQTFEQMAIPTEVAEDVKTAIQLRNKIIKLLNNPKLAGNQVWNEALLLSNELVKVCESAFFDGKMVQQNYFPQEHKMAVYFPFFGPTTLVLLLGLIKLLKEKKNEEIKSEESETLPTKNNDGNEKEKI